VPDEKKELRVKGGRGEAWARHEGRDGRKASRVQLGERVESSLCHGVRWRGMDGVSQGERGGGEKPPTVGGSVGVLRPRADKGGGKTDTRPQNIGRTSGKGVKKKGRERTGARKG